MMNKRLFLLAGLIFLAALLRLIPHPPNFAPITAMALFGGVFIADRRLALLLPLLAMFASDLLLGFHSQMLSVYMAFILIVAIGRWSRDRMNPGSLVLTTIGASCVFFTVTNFGVWVLDGLYPMTFQGLISCYTAAIPFFQNTLMGDAFFVALLFGGLTVAQWLLPGIRQPATA